MNKTVVKVCREEEEEEYRLESSPQIYLRYVSIAAASLTSMVWMYSMSKSFTLKNMPGS